jgi:DNA-binding CsgD family transcriptional regulator
MHNRRDRKTDQILEEILERLDLILNVAALQVASDKSITEGARLLKMAGLDNRTIARVLNTSDATVRTVTANLRVRVGARR